MTSLKLTYHRTNRQRVDLAITAPSGTTVAGLAAAMAERDPTPEAIGGPVTLVRLRDGTSVPLDPQEQVESTGLGSGAEVSLRSAAAFGGAVQPHAQAGVLTVVAGPDRGRTFELHPGSNLVGRDPSCKVRLTDTMVSKLHAIVHVGAVVEIRDANSTNGVEFGGGLVPSAVLRAGDQVKLGDTVITVHATTQAVLSHVPGPDQGTILFNRSPRVDPVYEGEELEAPTPPKRPPKRRFPLIPMLTPLIMGSVLFAVTGSRFALVFILLSPVMVLGSYVEDRVSRKREFKAAVADFREALAALGNDLREARDDEQRRRQGTHPSTSDLVRDTLSYGPLLWTRRPEHDVFLQLRLGLGTLKSRNKVKMPGRGESPQEVWDELTACVEPFEMVADVPVVAELPVCGALGVAGPEQAARRVARALLAQLVTLHSPAELVLTAVMSVETAKDWQWLKWLPHTSPHPMSAYTPLRCEHLTTGGASALALVSELDELITVRGAKKLGRFPVVVLFISDDADVDRARLVDIAERGPAQGVHVVWFAAAVTRLPAVCRTFVAIEGRGESGDVGYVKAGESVEQVTLETLSGSDTERLARGLSPVIDAGARTADDSDLPRVASFVKLARTPIDSEPQAVVDKWREAQPGLRALLGALGAQESLHVDLCTHGPHALVGGTTGAGKSELLQSWLLGMAVAHDPRRVNFLLVDYKGGSAFGVVKELPHSVGLVTDLNPHLVRRALTSLRAELTRREKIVEHHHAKDLSDLEKQNAPDTPARLVIVVDEFAALKKEIPEFVDGMVDIAQRGRSLGLHLILATQRPTGIISDQLRANTNLRIALRMADAGDSNDVLGSPMAAAFDLDIPGRAAARTGPGRVTMFQAAYAGGWTQPGSAGQDVVIRPMPFGIGAAWPLRAESTSTEGDSDIVRVVHTVQQANAALGLPPPPKPWLPELPEVVELAARRPGWTPGLVFGLCDVPAWQAQPPAVFDPDTSGNMLIYGAGGSGKSTLLRTLAVAGVRGDAGPCQVYGIDFGNRGLDLLQELPQVAPIVRGDDPERMVRLLDRLQQTVQARAGRTVKFPRILLLIDGMDSFYQQYPPGVSGVFERLVSVATLGRSAGVHLLMTAGRPNAVPGSIAATAQSRLVLRLAAEGEYALLGIRSSEALAADAPPGRGLFDRNEVQVAVVGGLDIDSEHAAITALAQQNTGVEPVPPIAVMPTRVKLSELTSRSNLPLIGVDNDTLEPVGFEPQGFFVIAGMPGSGRTTTMETVCASLRLHRPKMAQEQLKPGVDAETLRALTERLRSAKPHAIIVENFPDLADIRELAPVLENLFKICRDNNHLVVVEGESARLVKSDPVYQIVRSRRCGVGLQQAPGLQFATIFGFEQAKLPKLNTPPPGRGILVSRGVPSIVHIALPS